MPDKIVVRNVKKSFPTDAGPRPVIAGIEFSVAEGEFVAIIGPSGCGKTTMLSILAGFEHPDEGSVVVDGRPLERPSPNGIVIWQQGSVFPWLTVQQNLMFGLNGRADKRAIADHYINLVGLEGFEHGYPHELSGGMLKRVELARALAVKPDILYMDEPFGALDALTALRMRIELLRVLARERHTCLLVTHNVEEAIHVADRIFVLSSRPTSIRAVFEVPFAHPRDLGGAAAQQLKARILTELGIS